MKKVYVMLLAVALTGTVAAQTKGKAKPAKAKAKKETKAVMAEEPKMAAVVDEHAGHNHGAAPQPVAAQAAVTDVAAVAPKGEDNLQIEATHDFGKIPQGKPVTYDFEFKNIGKTELKLENVQAGCGCTTPTWQPGPYKPGEVAKINVGFNAGSVAPFNKPVTITYNGGLTKVITITGEVIAAPPAAAPENKGVQILKPNGK